MPATEEWSLSHSTLCHIFHLVSATRKRRQPGRLQRSLKFEIADGYRWVTLAVRVSASVRKRGERENPAARTEAPLASQPKIYSNHARFRGAPPIGVQIRSGPTRTCGGQPGGSFKCVPSIDCGNEARCHSHALPAREYHCRQNML